jgi:limonene 1,2-monooxygenase
MHWDVMEERARHFGTTVDRASWRLVGLVHCADTTEQAYRDVEFGIEQWFRYFQTVAAFPQMSVTGTTVAEMIAFVNTSGLGAIGTPDMCTEQIDRLMKQSNGGFGAYLLLAHEWANPEATRRNYELIARHVMPQFQGQAASTLEAKKRAEAARPVLAEQQAKAVEAMTQKYQTERQAGN